MTVWELAQAVPANKNTVYEVLRGAALKYPPGTFHVRPAQKGEKYPKSHRWTIDKKSFYWRLEQHEEPAPTAPPVAQRTTEDVRREMGLIK